MIEFNVGNYYGSLAVKAEGDKFFWGVENYDGHHWEEIPYDLYHSLIELGPKPKRIKWIAVED